MSSREGWPSPDYPAHKLIPHSVEDDDENSTYTVVFKFPPGVAERITFVNCINASEEPLQYRDPNAGNALTEGVPWRVCFYNQFSELVAYSLVNTPDYVTDWESEWEGDEDILEFTGITIWFRDFDP